MQTVYIGNTLVNDVFVGSQKANDVLSYTPTIVTSSLIHYFDASYSASAANWRDSVGNRTGSLFQTSYTSTYPESFNLTGSIPDINFGSVPVSLQGSGERTVIVWVYSKAGNTKRNMTWMGSVNSSDLVLFHTGSATGLNYVAIGSDATSSVATSLPISLNEWHQVAYTTDGTNTYGGINLWLDSNKAQLSGASTFNVGTLYWIFGTSNSNFPFSGSIFTQMIYNRKLTDNEILQNYQYFKYRLGLI